jgi:hypothetical protein
LIKGTEEDALVTLSEILNELKRIGSLKFGEKRQKLNIKCVFDYSALWKILKRRKFTVDEEVSRKEGRIVLIYVQENNQIEYEEHRGCPFCISIRKCSKKCKKDRNFQAKEGECVCYECQLRYNNFGNFGFNPEAFIFLNGLPPTSFIPCTIHFVKNVTVRMLQPFAKMSYQLTGNFDHFNKLCEAVFGKGVYAE